MQALTLSDSQEPPLRRAWLPPRKHGPSSLPASHRLCPRPLCPSFLKLPLPHSEAPAAAPPSCWGLLSPSDQVLGNGRKPVACSPLHSLSPEWSRRMGEGTERGHMQHHARLSSWHAGMPLPHVLFHVCVHTPPTQGALVSWAPEPQDMAQLPLPGVHQVHRRFRKGPGFLCCVPGIAQGLNNSQSAGQARLVLPCPLAAA